MDSWGERDGNQILRPTNVENVIDEPYIKVEHEGPHRREVHGLPSPSHRELLSPRTEQGGRKRKRKPHPKRL